VLKEAVGRIKLNIIVIGWLKWLPAQQPEAGTEALFLQHVEQRQGAGRSH